MDLDARIRAAAIEYVLERSRIQQGELGWMDLQNFAFEGRQVRLAGQRGIWKPQGLDLPISITTAPPRSGRPAPYDDEVGDDDLLRYRYQGTVPSHADNRGLREAMRRRLPLIYLKGVVKGIYVAAAPVYIVGDDPTQLTFTVAVDDQHALLPGFAVDEGNARKQYVTRMTRVRMHQQGFRVRVLEAYARRCAVCRLRHTNLLDAAHIIPDREEAGVASVRNGLSLCKLHHAAYDDDLIGIRPDLVIELPERVREEKDGPMLLHGLQEFHGQKIVAPRQDHKKPDPQALEWHYERFRSAG